ncbi:hypothetical protein [Aquibacillus salsiterrae]|nr:hypothetical protein [Aquibacillus salsiterrae]
MSKFKTSIGKYQMAYQIQFYDNQMMNKLDKVSYLVISNHKLE